MSDIKTPPAGASSQDQLVRSAVKCTLEENVNRAAADLPYGWEIAIRVELNAGWVELNDPDGNLVELVSDGTINEQVSEAISYAREHS